MKTVGRRFKFDELMAKRTEFQNALRVEIMANDLGGFVLPDVSIDHLAQTPIAGPLNHDQKAI